MATKQTAYFKGGARPQFPEPKMTGQVAIEVFTHVFTEDVLTTDTIELFPFLANSRIVAFDFVTANLAGTTLDIGVMTGEMGSTDPARTLLTGNQLLMDDAAAAGAVATLVQINAFARNTDAHRSIGMRPATNITLGGTKTITIRVTYELV